MKAVAATRVERGDGTSPVRHRHALAMLSAEHRAILAMFRDYHERRGGAGASALARGKLGLRICHLMTLHSCLEEELFYPAVERVLGKAAQQPALEARVEHECMKGLIASLKNLPARDPRFDATMKVLANQARRHFSAEEKVLFPLLRRTSIDLAGLGETMASREEQLSTRRPGQSVFREGRRVMAG